MNQTYSVLWSSKERMSTNLKNKHSNSEDQVKSFPRCVSVFAQEGADRDIKERGGACYLNASSDRLDGVPVQHITNSRTNTSLRRTIFKSISSPSINNSGISGISSDIMECSLFPEITSRGVNESNQWLQTKLSYHVKKNSEPDSKRISKENTSMEIALPHLRNLRSGLFGGTEYCAPTLMLKKRYRSQNMNLNYPETSSWQSIKTRNDELYSRPCAISTEIHRRTGTAPVKCPRPSRQNDDSDLHVSEDESRYDIATWTMYYRIMNARQASLRCQIQRDSSVASLRSTNVSNSNGTYKAGSVNTNISRFNLLSLDTPSSNLCTSDHQDQKLNDHEGVFSLDMDYV